MHEKYDFKLEAKDLTFGKGFNESEEYYQPERDHLEPVDPPSGPYEKLCY